MNYFIKSALQGCALINVFCIGALNAMNENQSTNNIIRTKNEKDLNDIDFIKTTKFIAGADHYHGERIYQKDWVSQISLQKDSNNTLISFENNKTPISLKI